MDDKENKQSDKQGTTNNVLSKLDKKLPEPDVVIKWYVKFLKSDSIMASLSFAILMTIQMYFVLNWETFFQKMLLFYTIYATILLSKILREVTKYGSNRNVETK